MRKLVQALLIPPMLAALTILALCIIAARIARPARTE